MTVENDVDRVLRRWADGVRAGDAPVRLQDVLDTPRSSSSHRWGARAAIVLVAALLVLAVAGGTWAIRRAGRDSSPSVSAHASVGPSPATVARLEALIRSQASTYGDPGARLSYVRTTAGKAYTAGRLPLSNLAVPSYTAVYVLVAQGRFVVGHAYSRATETVVWLSVDAASFTTYWTGLTTFVPDQGVIGALTPLP